MVRTFQVDAAEDAPINYVPADDELESHLDAIDAALGVLSSPTTLPRQTITALLSPYAVQAADVLLIVDSSGGPVSLLLPALVPAGGVARRLIITQTAGGLSTVTATPNGVDTIMGAPLYTLPGVYTAATLVDAGTTWTIT